MPDTDVLRAQLEQCHKAAYSWALCCCSDDPVEAEEVLQMVYLKVLEGAARYQGQSAFKTWLYAVIRKTATGRQRTALLHRVLLARNADQVVVGVPPTRPEDQVQETQVLRRFREALQGLPKRQREILTLVFAQDLTLQQSATVLGVALGSARRHYERGKQRLRQLLADLEDSDAR